MARPLRELEAVALLVARGILDRRNRQLWNYSGLQLDAIHFDLCATSLLVLRGVSPSSFVGKGLGLFTQRRSVNYLAKVGFYWKHYS